jgi:hypothetical protein
MRRAAEKKQKEADEEQTRLREEQLQLLKEQKEEMGKNRSGMLIKYFASKVSPDVNDAAGKKTAFGVWKEVRKMWRWTRIYTMRHLPCRTRSSGNNNTFQIGENK